MRRAFSILAATVLLLSATGCSNKDDTPVNAVESAEAGELRLPTLTIPTLYNPCFEDEGADSIMTNLYSRLFKITTTGEIAGDLIAEWDYRDEVTRLELTLRSEGILWHDGEPLTANDVKFTLDTILSQRGLLAGELSAIDRIEVTDDTTFIIVLKEHDPFLLYKLADVAASILPAHIYEGKNPYSVIENPIGSGPFKLADSQEEGTLTLESHNGYYLGKAELSTLTYKLYPSIDSAVTAFEVGEIDILDIGLPMDKIEQYEQEGYTVTTIDNAQRISLVYNVNSGIFVGNPTLRKAVAAAIDKTAIDSALPAMLVEPTDSFIPSLFPLSQNTDATTPDFNTRTATELLESQYEQKEDGEYASLTMTIFDAEPYPEIAAVIKQNLEEVGINLTVVQLTYDQWVETVLKNGEFEMALSGGSYGPYPEAMVHRFAEGGTLNYGGYGVKEVSDKLYAAITEGKEGLRNSYLFDVQETLAEHLPVLPIVEWYDPVVIGERVQNPPQMSAEHSQYEYVDTIVE